MRALFRFRGFQIDELSYLDGFRIYFLLEYIYQNVKIICEKAEV